MTTTCPCNNVMQFLDVSKKLSSDLTQVLHGLEKKLFYFCFEFFFMKELKGAILSQNHRRSQGGGPGGRAPQSKCHQ